MSVYNSTPKVSVCVITYNQAGYIRQCLQSIVDQITDFAFDVIVGDDCSTDGTREIVREFAERYPDIVKPIYQETNIGNGSHNFRTVHNAAEGEYIAHVDGDDYCLPGKLQAQAALLDSDPECNIAFHRMYVELPTGELTESQLNSTDGLEDLRFDRANIIQFISIGLHSSKMYRKTHRSYGAPNFDVTDYHANVEQVGGGYARFTGTKCFGVYRLGGGLATSNLRSRKSLAKSFVYFKNKYPQHRKHVNTAALTYLIADLKNQRKTWPMFLRVWLNTYHACSIPNLILNLKFINKLKLR